MAVPDFESFGAAAGLLQAPFAQIKRVSLPALNSHARGTDTRYSTNKIPPFTWLTCPRQRLAAPAGPIDRDGAHERERWPSAQSTESHNLRKLAVGSLWGKMSVNRDAYHCTQSDVCARARLCTRGWCISISDHAFPGERLCFRVVVEGGRVNWLVMVMGMLCDRDRQGVLGDRM